MPSRQEILTKIYKVPKSTRDVDPDPHSFSLLDTDPGGKFFLNNRKNARKFIIIEIFLLSKFVSASCFFTFEQSCLSLSTTENSS